jgi:hypothetical protein
MKFLKFLPILGCCLAAVTFTSCNSDDDYPSLTPEEVNQAFMAVKGNYEGDFIYLDPEAADKEDKTDTLAVSWEIDTDSTMTINNFPAAPLAMHITDATLAKAIAEQPDQPLKCHIGFYSVSPVGFLINPEAAEYEVEYDGKTHKVQVAFYLSTPYSYGAYSTTSKNMQMQIVVAGIYVDKELNTSLLKNAVAFGIEYKKESKK